MSDEKTKLKITKAQDYALNQICGLKQNAHYMVICAKKTSEGIFLVGTEQDFDDLLSDLYDEVSYELQSKTSLRHLQSLIDKLEPEYDENEL